MLNKEVKARIERNKVRHGIMAWRRVKTAVVRDMRLSIQTQALLSAKHLHDEVQREARIEAIRASNEAIADLAYRIYTMGRQEFHAYLREQRS